jgi:hypothetical protein
MYRDLRFDILPNCDLQIAANENDGIKVFESMLSLSTAEGLVELFGSVEGP